MEIVVEFHGVTRRLAGGPEHALRLAPGASVADALAFLVAHRPELAPAMPGCACAIGDVIVPRSRALAAGERLALLPPVSGG